ncbi:respiratory nitrate reductase subunit gamma, partial [bacterium]|nr:respiratory nitrate reductase subunit gamma [bacterium]
SEEIFLLKGIFENNRKMWYLSFPFHAGLYLLVVFLLFLIVGGVSALLGFPMQLLEFLNSLTVVTGVMGIILTLIGSIGLFLRRAFSAELREYSTPQDYFNLLLIFVIVFTAFMGWITTDNLFVTLGSYVQGLMIFSPGESLQGVSLWIIESIVLFSFYLLYFPFTQMTHPIGKYFMYHQVRWNDEPNIAGKTPKLVKQIENVLNYKVSWNASHIKGEGKKTWVDVATEEVKSDDK